MPEEHVLYASLGAHDLPDVDPILVGFDDPIASSIMSGKENFDCLLKRIMMNDGIYDNRTPIVDKIACYRAFNDDIDHKLLIACFDLNGNKIVRDGREYARLNDIVAPYITERKINGNIDIKVIEMEAMLMSYC